MAVPELLTLGCVCVCYRTLVLARCCGWYAQLVVPSFVFGFRSYFIFMSLIQSLCVIWQPFQSIGISGCSDSVNRWILFLIYHCGVRHGASRYGFAVVFYGRLCAVFGCYCASVDVCIFYCGDVIFLAQPNKGAAGNSRCPCQLPVIYEICPSSLHSTTRSAAVPELLSLGIIRAL